MLKIYHIIVLCVVLVVLSCKNDKLEEVRSVPHYIDTTFIENSISKDTIKKIINEDSISFYWWKPKGKYTETIDSVLNNHNVKSIYLHYFDVKMEYSEDAAVPTYVLINVYEPLINFNIIPVIFITNKTIKKVWSINDLSEKILKLIDQITYYQFDKQIKEIQIDCDWNQSTRKKYFELLKLLGKRYKISATIRLHQVKFKEKTGIPPVDEGILMVYNVGDLKNDKQNSILQSDIVAQYINKESTYPLRLKIALPLFSQIVIKNNDNQYRLANYSLLDSIKTDTDHFEKTGDNNYKVTKDTLFKGYYLSPGYRFKIERLKEKDIIESYKIVKESKLDVSDVIFYHLDDSVLKTIDLNYIIKKINK